MARIGDPFRHRKNWDNIRFIVTISNCVVILHLVCYSVRKTLDNSQSIQFNKRTRI